MATIKGSIKAVYQYRKKIITGVIVFLAFLYFVLQIMAPKNKIRCLFETGVQDKTIIITSDTSISGLIREKLFLESRIRMAGMDSIGLSVDLTDSLIALEIKGVMLHPAKIDRIKYGYFFRSLDDLEYSLLLGIPAKISSYRSTLEKEPVIIVEAPKDTLFADSYSFLPDTGRVKPVIVSLVLDNGVILSLIDNNSHWPRRSFRDAMTRAAIVKSGIYSMIRFKIPDYNPVIKLYLPGEDIKTIYRALPANGNIALKI